MSSVRDQISSQLLDAYAALSALERSWGHIITRWSVPLELHGASQLTESAQATRDLYAYITEPPPLKTLLLGGSGVGKSTLLNALAERDISSTSALIRAHTSSLVIYTHLFWRDAHLTDLAPSWSEELCDTSDRIEHEADALRDQWIIDAPDIDSTVLMHRARTLEALIEAELPIIVTSPQKYRDADCVRALRLIDERRPLVFVMTQLDEVWPEQRAELMYDLHALSVELDLQRVYWVGLDASRDSIQAESEGLTGLLDDARFQGRISWGVASLRRLLIEQLDEREIARLRLGYVAQRLSDIAIKMSAPQATIAELEDLVTLDHALHTTLTPVVHRYLERVSQRLRAVEEAAPGNLSALSARSNDASWLIWGLCRPLAWIWSWFLLSARERASSLTEEAHERAAALECVATLTQSLSTSRYARTAHDTREIQRRAQDALQEYLLEDRAPPITVAQVSESSVKILIASLTMTSLTALMITSSIPLIATLFTCCYLTLAWRALHRLQTRRGVKRRRSPHLQPAANDLTRRLISIRFGDHPRWAKLATSTDQEREPISIYRELRLDLAAHQHHAERVRAHVDDLLATDTQSQQMLNLNTASILSGPSPHLELPTISLGSVSQK